MTKEEKEAKIRDKRRRIIGGTILSILFPPLIIFVILEIIDLWRLTHQE